MEMNFAARSVITISQIIGLGAAKYAERRMKMEQREVDNMLLSMIQKHFPSLPLSDEYTDWGKWLGFARAVYEAGRASPASVPANFKMVPVEPTMEMCEAGWNEYDLQEHFSVRFMYERMIAKRWSPHY